MVSKQKVIIKTYDAVFINLLMRVSYLGSCIY